MEAKAKGMALKVAYLHTYICREFITEQSAVFNCRPGAPVSRSVAAISDPFRSQQHRKKRP